MRRALAAWHPAHQLQPHLRPAFATAKAVYSTSAAEWLASFTNHEQRGVPTAAGTDTADGFDLVRPLPPGAVITLFARCAAPLFTLQSPCDVMLPQGRMHRLLASLSSPHSAWAAAHVAGTKGKGSTVAMLAGVLRESGYRVGSYTR
jgi:hypothetical protein